MKVLIPITERVAIACIMEEFHFKNGVIKKMNINIFRKLVLNYTFAYGQSCVDDHQHDYEEYYYQALDIVNKYFK